MVAHRQEDLLAIEQECDTFECGQVGDRGCGARPGPRAWGGGGGGEAHQAALAEGGQAVVQAEALLVVCGAGQEGHLAGLLGGQQDVHLRQVHQVCLASHLRAHIGQL